MCTGVYRCVHSQSLIKPSVWMQGWEVTCGVHCMCRRVHMSCVCTLTRTKPASYMDCVLYCVATRWTAKCLNWTLSLMLSLTSAALRYCSQHFWLTLFLDMIAQFQSYDVIVEGDIWYQHTSCWFSNRNETGFCQQQSRCVTNYVQISWLQS